MSDTYVDAAGVLRCCLDHDFPEGQLGDKLPCKHATNQDGHGMELVERKGKRIWTAQWIADRDREPV